STHHHQASPSRPEQHSRRTANQGRQRSKQISHPPITTPSSSQQSPDLAFVTKQQFQAKAASRSSSPMQISHSPDHDGGHITSDREQMGATHSDPPSEDSSRRTSRTQQILISHGVRWVSNNPGRLHPMAAVKTMKTTRQQAREGSKPRTSSLDLASGIWPRHLGSRTPLISSHPSDSNKQRADHPQTARSKSNTKAFQMRYERGYNLSRQWEFQKIQQ
ncbi:hypothetical protein ACLOJK_026658, partial [Asimina triloba]